MTTTTLLLALLISSATSPSPDATPSFEFYFPADPAIVAMRIDDASLTSLELTPEPFLTSYDLRAFEPESHMVFLNDEGAERFRTALLQFQPDPHGPFDFRPPVTGKPFVALAGDERLWIGAFIPATSSGFFRGPTIASEWLSSAFEIKAFHLDGGYPGLVEGDPDKTQDPRFVEALRRDNLLMKQPLSGAITHAEFKSIKNPDGKPAMAMVCKVQLKNESDKPVRIPSAEFIHRFLVPRIDIGGEVIERSEWPEEESRRVLMAGDYPQLMPGAKRDFNVEFNGYPAAVPEMTDLTKHLRVLLRVDPQVVSWYMLAWSLAPPEG